jgi:steroid 5-alpha reductase family enzyme
MKGVVAQIIIVGLASSARALQPRSAARQPASFKSHVGLVAASPAKLRVHASPKLALAPVATSAAIIGAGNAVGLAISAAFPSCHYHLDLIGTGVFAVVAVALRGSGEPRQMLSSVGVGIWATKLAGFLFYRALQTTRDTRLEETLSTTAGAFGFWLISFLWGFVVSLPHTLAAGVPLASRPPFGGIASWGGMAMYAVGLFLETAADGQKWMFKENPANRGKFCDVGVWQISQHPNWVGNLLIWSGLFVFNAPTLVAGALKGAGLRRFGRLALAAMSPLFLLALFSAQATDKIANTAALAMAKYGEDPRYQEYVKTVPLLLPTFGSILRYVRGS